MLYFEPFLLISSRLLSVFGEVSLTQRESPTTGCLSFAVLNVYWNREGGKAYKHILLLCGSKLELSACLCDKCVTRYEFLKNFGDFLSRFCHSGLRRLTRTLTSLPYVIAGGLHMAGSLEWFWGSVRWEFRRDQIHAEDLDWRRHKAAMSTARSRISASATGAIIPGKLSTKRRYFGIWVGVPL